MHQHLQMGVDRVLGARVMSLQDGLMQLGVHSGPAMEAHAKLRIEPTWREGVRVVRQVSWLKIPSVSIRGKSNVGLCLDSENQLKRKDPKSLSLD